MIPLNIKIPEAPLSLLRQLEHSGYEAFVVGGCVRDSILGNAPNDWDITTNARPTEVMECFNNYTVVPTGLKHGTVSVVLQGENYEITTYRIDGDYKDHRRPEEVHFTTSLQEDLARRDFTMNALAYHPEKGLQDFYAGYEDIQKRIIKCVGEPEKRFQEDALRLFRCVRFASQLGFQIEIETEKAMLSLLPNLRYVAAERVQEELNKSLFGDWFRPVCCKYPEVLLQIIPEMEDSIGFNQNTHYHIYTVYEHTLYTVEHSPKDLTIRLTMLLHDIGKPQTYAPDSKGVGHFPKHARVSRELAEGILSRLKYSREMTQAVLVLIERHGLSLGPNKRIVSRWLNRLGKHMFQQLMTVQKADAKSKNPKYGKIQYDRIIEVENVFEEIIEEGACFSLSQLAITGGDLISIGVPQGPQVGDLLEQLLYAVIDGKLKNENHVLISYAKTLLT